MNSDSKSELAEKFWKRLSAQEKMKVLNMAYDMILNGVAEPHTISILESPEPQWIDDDFDEVRFIESVRSHKVTFDSNLNVSFEEQYDDQSCRTN